ncbi:1,5-anhydro-D-fructose reductase [Botrimarina colliarenosi]|uniref:1,5-anhydro-D-fructose reductase n=1 Tax=Botrimarina colliarenosi TaxID=2528001 RepID=A0A5C6AIM3_9BACT|nr:Gfo/Idh/MocA family oxidoreductase [Botrimarina colliarenosi]TWT99469.1 1,5-anhydro-D-fructose reductase [Botrimarina colliarenosi]
MTKPTTDATAHLTRRGFLRTSATAAAVAAPYFVPSSVFGETAPSNRITVAFIGTGNQGFLDLTLFMAQPDCQVVAVCDVNKGSDNYKEPSDVRGREPAKALVESTYAKRSGSGKFKGCDTFNDFREVLARKDVDAVVIVSPDHWHDVMAIAAAKAGKDIYGEKPLGLTIAGQQAMIKAVRDKRCVFQTGSHERSNPYVKAACDLVQSGAIGKVRRVVCNIGRQNKLGPGPGWEPTPIPSGFDYDMWLGPAPEAPYHKDRCLYNFRFIDDYAGGQTANFGAHSIDIAQWGLGTSLTGPKEVEYVYADYLPEGSLFNAATFLNFRCKYENGTVLDCVTAEPSVRTAFYGDDGIVSIDNQGQNALVIPRKLTPEKLQKRVKYHSGGDHVRNFLDCVKSREEPVAPIEVGHRSASICHLGNISLKLQTKLKWNPEVERFEGGRSDEANKLLSREQRSPWKIS